MNNAVKKKINGASSSPQRLAAATEIEKRAYEVWQAEGGQHGDDLKHWLQAEGELTKFQTGQRGMSSTKTKL